MTVTIERAPVNQAAYAEVFELLLEELPPEPELRLYVGA